MAALVQLSVHILCLLSLDDAFLSAKLAVTVTMKSSFHSMQQQPKHCARHGEHDLT